MNAREFDAAIFCSVDRFARKAFYLELMLNEAKRWGVDALFVTQSFDPTPVGVLLRSMAGHAAERAIRDP